MPYEYSDQQKQDLTQQARDAGVSQDYINNFLGTNPDDYNRLISSYNSQQTGQGEDSMVTGGAWVPAQGAMPATLGGMMGLPGTNTGGFTGMGLPGPFNGQFTPPGANLSNIPGYQFGLNEQQRAMQNSAAAKGTLLTGRTAQALGQAAGDYANTNYQQYYNNLWNQYLNTQQVQNQNFNQALAGNYLGLYGQNQAFNQNLAGQNFGLEAQNQAYNQGLSNQYLGLANNQFNANLGQQQFSNWLNWYNAQKPPYPSY